MRTAVSHSYAIIVNGKFQKWLSNYLQKRKLGCPYTIDE